MDRELYKIVGERLKSVRMQLGFSRREFADKCGFSAATLQAWEDGRYPVPQKSMVKYVKTLFDCGLITSPEWFIKGEGLPPRPVNKLSLDSIAEKDAILREINFFETENKNPIITVITDDSMLPFFSIGDYVGGKLISGDYAERYIDTFCIIHLASGETLVRKLRPGSEEGHFNLISTNLDTNAPSAFLLNCEIVQLAQVIWHRKVELPLDVE
ncbi:MAG: helix-turn-helix transcriptional regulator [Legionella sp.]|uniref:helix-turn-helix domain-containing protein n=1 Tax=Legionella sp. TaxID=459 RepID=UPI0039E22789